MLFNSLQFIVFFIIVTSLYFALPYRYRNAMLLLSSCYFYMSFVPVYLPIMGISILVGYVTGILIFNDKNNRHKIYLSIGIILTVCILAFFKYYISYNNYLLELIYGINKAKNPSLSIILPVGLSFHTFQIISYMIEVKRKNIKPEYNFGIFSLYVLFFPQLVAGPIERPQNLLPQFREEHSFNFTTLKQGAMLMVFGLFKKVVIADRLGMFVDASYGNSAEQTGSVMLAATLLYSLQLYFDFSAYSEIALGSAGIMGFKLTNNFNSPYFSKSITEFWTKWHISLSTWLRDYLFLPVAYKMLRVVKHKLLGMKPEVWSYVTATIITMTIAGFWHGESSAFVVWGILHGVYLVVSFIKGRVYKKLKIRIRQNFYTGIVRTLITFLLVSFAWIFFRSGNLDISELVIGKIFSTSVFTRPEFTLSYSELIFALIFSALVLIKEKYWQIINTESNFKFFVIITCLIVFSYLFGIFNQEQFIYFQF